jgi:hypothetical protein
MPITFDPFIVEDNLLERLEKIFNYYDHLKDAQGNFNRNDFQIRIAKASYEENIQLYSSSMRISTISELNQFKLYLIVKYVLDSNIPTENEVSQLFKITNSTASTLIRNMQSRYQIELQNALNSSILAILHTVDFDDPALLFDGDYYEIYIRSNSLVKTMNQILQYSETSYPPISLCRGTNNKYKIFDVTRIFLTAYTQQ